MTGVRGALLALLVAFLLTLAPRAFGYGVDARAAANDAWAGLVAGGIAALGLAAPRVRYANLAVAAWLAGAPIALGLPAEATAVDLMAAALLALATLIGSPRPAERPALADASEGRAC